MAGRVHLAELSPPIPKVAVASFLVYGLGGVGLADINPGPRPWLRITVCMGVWIDETRH